IPRAVQRVHAEEKSCLENGRRLADEELQAEKQRAERKVTRVMVKKKPADVETCQRQPRDAEENRQQVDVGEIEAAEAERDRADERGIGANLHRPQQRVHPQQSDVDVKEDVQPVSEI